MGASATDDASTTGLVKQFSSALRSAVASRRSALWRFGAFRSLSLEKKRGASVARALGS